MTRPDKSLSKRTAVMKSLTAAGWMLSLFLVCGSQQAGAGAFEGGWDVIAGDEKHASDGWYIGAQLHYIKG